MIFDLIDLFRLYIVFPMQIMLILSCSLKKSTWKHEYRMFACTLFNE